MCDCFHLAFPNWHAASSGTGPGRRLRGPEPGTEDDSVCDEPSQFTEGERPRPQGSSPVEEYPEKFSESDKECEAEHDPKHKSGSGKKTKKSGLGSMFEKRSTPKMSKLKEVHSPESGVIVKTAKDGCAEGLIYGGGGKEGIFIKEVVPESPASKSLKLKEGDQILSATVYFDNVSYEDAIQILEHAQAYKVKLCLKRKPDITETEPAIDSNVIPEEELYAPEMREQGKTKRRGDARISWPKFSSFGKGRKSRFTRSHSSSEADEQRKLELSPTTSDTESPIKSQDALKGKKRHKMKLSVMTKRGRISSSEDQDTDGPTTGQTSADNYQTASDMLSPECLESLSGETLEVHLKEDLKVDELRLEQSEPKLMEPQSVQHKVELISIDSTLKTADLTVALADQESSSGMKSPTEKKKKETSELKIKIFGKDKSPKKDAKAKASPKRLKTLGASIEKADQPQNQKSDDSPGFQVQKELQEDQLPLEANTQIISSQSARAKMVTTQTEMNVPKVELSISDATIMQKSPKKSEEKARKDKDRKQKQEKKAGEAFKLPKVTLSDIATEEIIQKTTENVEERQAKMKQLKSEGTEMKDDPYDKLSKSNLSRTQLPKREDIEIPGMEDKTVKTKGKRIKAPKAIATGHREDNQSETVQLLIDVDSVKEAVSKLPGFKLPKVDTSGIPIPEEITVIDANAQRISVKTPTKVVDTKTKHEAHFTKFDITAPPEISKTTIKPPKITAADLPSNELLTETKVDYKKPDKAYGSMPMQSDIEMKTEIDKREDIIIPGKESAKEETMLQEQRKKTKVTTTFGISKPDIRVPDVGIELPKQAILGQKDYKIKGERALLHQEVTSKTQTKKGTGHTEGVITDVKVPESDSFEYIDSAGGSPAKKSGGIKLTGFGVDLGVTPDVSVNVPEADMRMSIDGAGIKMLEREGQGSKVTLPNIGISMPKAKGPKFDVSLAKKDVTSPEAKAQVKLLAAPETDSLGKVDVDKPHLDIKSLQTEGELDGQGSKFKMPKLGIKMPKIKGPEFDLSMSKKDGDVTLPEAKAGIKLPDAPKVDIDLGKADVSIPEMKIEVEKPELEVKPLQTEVELDGQGSKFKMPKFGVKMPKIKGPEFDLSMSKKDVDVTLPEAKAGIKLPDVPDVDVTLGSAEVSIPGKKIEVEKPELEIKSLQTEVEPDGERIKFKMPKFGVKMPKIKGPEFDLSMSKKDADVTLPEAKAGIKLPDAPKVDIDLGKADVSIPEMKIEVEKPELDVKPLQTEAEVAGSKFKMPKFGIKMPKIKGPEFDLSMSKKDGDVTQPEAKAGIKLPDAPKVDIDLGKADVSIPEMKIEVEKPELEVKPLQTEVELDGQGSKFKMPKFGIKMPKIKGPEFDLSMSKKDVDVTLPEAKADVKLPDVPDVDVTLGSAEVSIPRKKIEVEKPELEIKSLQTEVEPDGERIKFKMPKFGVKMPKIKGPEFDLSMSKKDADVTLPEAKAGIKLPDAPKVDIDLGKADVSIPEMKIEVEKPELDVKPLQTEAEVAGSKFKMPKFGIKMPKIKGPEFDLSMSKKDGDVTLPEAKAGIKLPDAPKVDIDLGKADVSIPEMKIEVEKPELEVKPLQTEVELDGQGSKFKMPKFGIKMPKIKGPEFDLSMSKKDVDVTLPEAKADVKLPDVPDVDVTLGSAEVSIPGKKIEVEKPELEIKSLQTEVEPDGERIKFKMPKFGVKMPKIKGPEFDLSMSKKDADVTLPEAKAGIKLPDAPKVDIDLGKADVSIPEMKIEVEKPELDVKPLQTEAEVAGSKFKMPKFGVKMPKIKGPEFDLSMSKKDGDVTLPEAKADVKLPDVPDVDVTLGSVEVSIPGKKVEVEKPELEVQPLRTEVELDGERSKFKMPKFGVKMPKIKGPEFDLSMSKKDVDVTLPETKGRIKLPDAPDVDVTLGTGEFEIPGKKIEIEKPDVEIKSLQTEVEPDGERSKFKMPKFGIKMPKIKGPEFDLSFSKKDVDVTLPEAKADVKLPDVPDVDVTLGSVEVSIPGKKIEVEKPELEVQPLQTEVELDGERSKFKMPKFGVKMPKIKGPEFDLSMSKKDGDVTLPETKGRIKLPDAPDVDVTLGSGEFDITGKKIEVEKPELDIKPLQTEVELDGQGSKFKMPKLGITMPKVKGPEFDLSLSKKEVDLALPEAKAEVNLPDVELKEPSVKVEIKGPEIKGTEKDAEGSPSKFKMPTFKLPKFGASTPNVNIEVSSKSKDIHLPETQLKSPEGVIVDIKTPDIDVESPSLEVKTTSTELDGKGSKFKMPKFGISMPKVKRPETDLSLPKKDIDVTLPQADIELPDVEHTEAGIKVEVKAPEVAIHQQSIEGSPSKFKMPTFKLPKFGVSTPKVSAEAPDIKIPDDGAAIDTEAPNIDFEGPSIDLKTTEMEHEGKGSKFKMPHFGFSMPKVKGPKIDLSLSQKDVDVTLPEAKAGVKLPGLDLGEVDVSIPKTKMEVPGVKADVHLPEGNLGKVDVSIPETKIEIPTAEAELKLPEAPKIAVAIKSPEFEADMDGHGGKFKIPKFGIKMPKVKGPEFDLSLSKKDVDARLPEMKGEAKLPDAPKVNVSLPDKELEIKAEDERSNFKMPKFGMSMEKVKGPEFHLGFSKKDVDVKLPETKADINLPDVDLKTSSAKVDIKAPEIDVPEGSPSKFKMPSFSMPKVKGPDIDLSLSKKQIDVTLPETKSEVPKMDVSLGKAEVLIPDTKVEVKKPEVQVRNVETDVEGQGGKFKMPKFGITMPKVHGPEFDLRFSKKDTDVTLPGAKAKVEIPEAPKTALDVKPECEVEIDGQGSRFKLPKFEMSMPKVKGPDIDFSLPKKDVDVTLPEGKAEVQLPDVELKDPSAKVEFKDSEMKAQLGHVEGSPSKFKLPTFKLPKFGAGTAHITAEVPNLEKDIKVDGAGLEILKHSTTGEIAAPSVDIEGPSLDVKMTGKEGEGKGIKFKMPKFGITMPKGPEIDLSLSKKDIDVKLPEAKAEVNLPQGPEIDVNLGNVDVSIPEAKVEVKKSEFDGKGGKFKIPKFGMSMPKVKGPEIDLSSSKKDVDITLPEGTAEVNLPAVELKEHSAKVEVNAPEIQAQLSSSKGSPSKFKLPTFNFPKFGVTTPNISAELPDGDKEIKIDGAQIQMPEPHIDVDVPDVKAELSLPEVKAPSGAVVIEQQSAVEVDAKLKKPRFSLPKFSFSKPNIKSPEVDVSPQDVHVEIPEVQVEVKGGEVGMKPPEGEAEFEEQGKKFKMPKFGISMPKVSGPEINLSLSKPDVDVALPEPKAEVQLPDVEMKGSSAEVEMKTPEVKVSGKETSPSKFKMPTFKLPKFGVSTPSSTVEVPVPEKNLKIDGEEEILAVTIAAPSIDTQEPSIDIKTTGTEREGKGSKFKLPSLGFSPPHVKGPEIDLSVSKKDVEMSLPEAKGKIELPDVKLKKPSAEVEITTPEIKVSGKETSPSKFKMPSFKLPKFGVSTPSSTVEVPVKDKNLKIDGEEEILAVTIAAPDIDTQEPTIDIKTTGTEHEGKGSKFKLPSLGFSTPHVKGPEIDFSASKKDVEMSLPEAKGKIELPDVELKKPSAEVEITTPEIKVSGKETSPSKFKMPSFKLPKFGVSTPSSTVEVPVKDKNLKIDGEEEILAVTITAPNIDTQGPSIDIKTTGTEHEGKGSKFKLPSLGFSTPHVKGPQIDLSVSKKDVDVTIPEGKADVQLPGVELKEPSVKVETEASGTEVQSSDVEGSPSKFKMPSFKLPKFGTTSPQISVEVPEVDGADLKLPEVKAAVKLPDIEVKEPVVSLSASEAPMAEGDASAKKTSWTLPKFSFSKTSIKGPEADVNLDTPKVDVALPETKTEIHPPDIDANISSSISVEGAPSTDIDPTLKKTRFSLPKFSFSKQSTKELDVDISLPEAAVSLPEGYVKVKPPAVELKPTESEIELDGQENKFKMPRFGISMPRVKGPEIDLSLSKKNIDVTLPENKAEVQMPDVKTKQLTPKVEIKTPEIEAQKSHAEASPSKLKMPTFTLPKFGATTPKVSVQVPDVEKDIEIDGAVDVTALSIDIEGQSVDVKAKGIETEGSGSKFKMPHFGISKPKIKGPEIDLTLSTKRADVTLQGAKAEVALPSVEVKKAEGAISVPAHASLPEGEIKVRQPAVEMKTPELQQDVQGSKFKMPKFGITLPKAKGPEADLKVFQQDVDVTLPEVKAEVKLPEVHTKESSASVETEAKSKDAGGSPLKFKMPTVKMPKIGGVSVERSDAALSTETTVAEPKEDVAVSIKGPSITIKTDVPKTLDSETQKTQTDGAGLVSPSKFKLPSFKMPKLSFSRKPEDEYVPEEEDQLKMDIKTQEETKSPKRTLTSFGEIFKNIDVEFDVPEIEQEEENLETSKAVQKTAKPTEMELQAKDSERNKKQDTIKSPERTGWFKFPKFGLSSPSEPAKVSEKDQQKDEKSPEGETGDEEVSPTCSVQSSDAFADISSAMTSEHLGLSSSSPTKVTVKYTGPDVPAGFEEIRSNIITSTTSTGLISVEPNLPEKITILSSGVSSSSEDTLRLESGKIHVITSNIQATPEAQHAKVVTAIQVQSSGGLPLESEASKAASWTVEESQSSKKSILGKYFVRGTSTEISETKETIVITKQITRTSEPISGETASSIQRLRDSVHSEKMKFFDGAEK